MADCFDITYSITHDMKDIAGYSIPITTLIDSESLFELIVKSTSTTKERLMTDVRATHEAFQNEMSDIGWIRSNENTADGLTKTWRCLALEDLMNTGVLTTKVEQWIDRKEKGDMEKRTHQI